ncbi:MAG: esterase family protein [Ignavibacteriales bacterium]|nr:esterase family protein [Ignavibacteriales bacterium]
MNREYHKWFSASLQRDMELLMFGQSGTPVLVFPTLRGRFYEYEDKQMLEPLAEKIENGELQIFCVDSIDGESWSNYDSHPSERPLRHLEYEKYISDEVVPFINSKNPSEDLIVHGCGFGGYHAVNFALRYPSLVTGCVSLGGNFDIKQYVFGFFDDNCYYNSPLDFLPSLEDESLLIPMRERIKFILGTGENDFALTYSVQLSRIMESKNIPHWLDIWRDGTGHDWHWWKKMAKKYFITNAE